MSERRWISVPEDCPQASSVQVVFCCDPGCGRPHVILFDENDKPIATFVAPDYRPGGFLDNLRDAYYKTAALREEPR